jgi:hypothetical protein
MAQKVTEQDQFGQPIPLNYDGEDTFKTFPGGILSIIMLICFMCYTVLKFKYMISHEEWNLTQQHVRALKTELLDTMKFDDHKNVSIGLQFNQRKVSVSKEAWLSAAADADTSKKDGKDDKKSDNDDEKEEG